MHSNDYTPFRNRCRDDGVVEQPSLPQQTEQTFFQLLHIMDLRTADPLLKYTPDAVVQIRRIGWPHLWGINSGVSLCSMVTASHVW